MKVLTLRAHHGMCLAFFEGKGYNDTFTRHMAEIQMKMAENPILRIGTKADVICKKCPHLKQGICEQTEQVAAYDYNVLEQCEIAENTIMTWEAFSLLVQKQILAKDKRKEICTACRWSYICSKKEQADGKE